MLTYFPDCYATPGPDERGGAAGGADAGYGPHALGQCRAACWGGGQEGQRPAQGRIPLHTARGRHGSLHMLGQYLHVYGTLRELAEEREKEVGKKAPLAHEWLCGQMDA